MNTKSLFLLLALATFSLRQSYSQSSDIIELSSREDAAQYAEEIDLTQKLPIHLNDNPNIKLSGSSYKVFKFHLDGNQIFSLQGEGNHEVYSDLSKKMVKPIYNGSWINHQGTISGRGGSLGEGDYYLFVDARFDEEKYVDFCSVILSDYVEDLVISIDDKFAGAKLYTYSSAWDKDNRYKIHTRNTAECFYHANFQVKLKAGEKFSASSEGNTVTILNESGETVATPITASEDMTLTIWVDTSDDTFENLKGSSKPFSVSFVKENTLIPEAVFKDNEFCIESTWENAGAAKVRIQYEYELSYVLALQKGDNVKFVENDAKIQSLKLYNYSGKTLVADLLNDPEYTAIEDGDFVLKIVSEKFSDENPETDLNLCAERTSEGDHTPDDVTGMQNVFAKSAGTVEAYNVHGVKVAEGNQDELSLPQGVYILRQDNSAEKVLVK